MQHNGPESWWCYSNGDGGSRLTPHALFVWFIAAEEVKATTPCLDAALDRLCVDEPAGAVVEHVRIDPGLIGEGYIATDQGQLCGHGFLAGFDPHQFQFSQRQKLFGRFSQKTGEAGAGKASGVSDALLPALVQVDEDRPSLRKLF